MNKLNIRQIRKEEYNLLDDFLYEAIFIPKGTSKPPKKIIKNEELQVYIKDFGTYKDDNCLIAEYDNKIVGACWTRIIDDYGHIDNKTPSFAISLYEEYRGKGIGTKLMKSMLAFLKEKGYRKISLSVQKNNYAVKMYKNVGFKIIDENKEEYIMLCDL
ncbi:MAG: GNAT family N-acetyltransferase [Clostridia bacterium]